MEGYRWRYKPLSQTSIGQARTHFSTDDGVLLIFKIRAFLAIFIEYSLFKAKKNSD